MPRYRLHVSYDGTDYCGWQKQGVHKYASPLPSLQQTLESALAHILNHPVEVSASGRTDAGVHALKQVCHFESSAKMPIDLCWALRSKLPPSISVKESFLVPDDFHATLSAVRKTYRYWIWNHPRPPALLARYSWWLREPLSLVALNEISTALIGKKDFASFRTKGTPVKTTVREIFSAEWNQRPSGLLEFNITGGGFMKQMVRNIVGTLTNLAEAGETSQKMSHIISLVDRRAAGVTAPPQGLFLRQVYYPKSLDIQCRQI
jgi:tRNA pseudouridine38-40 synthase